MDYFTPYSDAFETTLSNLEKVMERCEQTNVALSTEKHDEDRGNCAGRFHLGRWNQGRSCKN